MLNVKTFNEGNPNKVVRKQTTKMLTRLDGRVLKLVSPKTETNYSIRHFNVVDIQMLILLTLHLVSLVKVNSE